MDVLMTAESVPLTVVLKYLKDHNLAMYANKIPHADGFVSVAEAFPVADREKWCEDFNLAVHRLTGAECVERSNGDRFWYRNGELHRDGGPAVEYADGGLEWYQNGKFHRTDGPARENAYGDRFWCYDGQLHRDDGPAVEYANGPRYWYQHGELFRIER